MTAGPMQDKVAELEGFSGERIHVGFDKEMNYVDFLQLDKILGAQRLWSGEHDEMLFMIIHQVKELWMKLLLHELEAAFPPLRAGNLRPAFKMFARVKRLFDNLIQAWSILTTMTPSEYMRFRDKLARSSGFQSYQYRAIEYLLGNKHRGYIRPHDHRPDLVQYLTALLERPSLYDEVVMLLARRGFAIDAQCLKRDWSEKRAPNGSVVEAWAAVYRDPAAHWDLYELAESLVDIDDLFQTWRFRHRNAVERVIGMKPGTGGTSGVGYLKKAIEIRLFDELWAVRTQL
jgi:tryptophan 2,3-dioxygenase